MSEAVLRIDGLQTYYGKIHALKGISLSVQKGQIVTLLGANGADKSTTLKTISGLVRPILWGRPCYYVLYSKRNSATY
jgi:branched-chain amino acid transport system ATP-binding protein